MQQNKRYFVIDFDSTFTTVEGLDELGAIALAKKADGDKTLNEIRKITDKGMDGSISFADSLKKRIALLQADKSHLEQLIESLKSKVSASFSRNRDFVINYANEIIIISSGFKEFILPVVSEFGISENNVYANTFLFNEAGQIIGVDNENVLAKDNGKVQLLKQLNLDGDVYVIGDGYTDYQIKAAGLANKFYAFTENVSRDKVVAKADHIAPTLDEILYINKLPMTVSYPKNRINVLMLEGIHTEGQRIFSEEGYNIEVIKSGLDEEELCEKIRDVSILCIRSKTQVTPKVLENANRLIAIGAFCIGTNQIALDDCMQKGIAVFNAPYSNTRSVVELAIGEIIMLMRNAVEKSKKLHNGIWDKTAGNSFEIRGKKLGIVGYGNIGAQLSVLAEALGMQVYYYDIVEKLVLGNARKCASLNELLSLADIVTLHVDGRAENKNLIGEEELSKMKNGALLLNLSRGGIVDIPALAKALKSGKLHGAAVDVFPYEPKSNDEKFINELCGIDNVILTPHIGGSTQEAQFNIANFVPSKIIEYINTGNTFSSVNFPNLQLPEFKNSHRLIHIHENTPGILAKINSVLADHSINIVGQYLKTNERIGYVITDIDKAYDKEVVKSLKEIPHTIKFRILY